MEKHSTLIFPIKIWGFILNNQKYESVDYINIIEKLELTEPSQKRSNFGGYQTHEHLNKLPIFRELVVSLENITSECLGFPTMITEMWGNINYKHCFNRPHIHGETLAGVFYLKVPENSGRLVLCNPAVRSEGKFVRESDYSITPKDFSLIIFPSWLEHYVEPNLSNEKRISISFNAAIKK